MLTPMFVEDLPPWLIRGVAFVFGALWGSFFNVAIYRWPREMSVVSPPSHCPSCGAPVRSPSSSIDTELTTLNISACRSWRKPRLQNA